MEVVVAVVGLGPKFSTRNSFTGRRNSVHAPTTLGADTNYNQQANLIFTRSLLIVQQAKKCPIFHGSLKFITEDPACSWYSGQYECSHARLPVL
jgi:hypothetical protein